MFMRSDAKNIEGKVFGSLTAIEPVKSVNGNVVWKYKCVCGNNYEQKRLKVESRKTSPNCGCGGIPKGRVFNSLTFLGYKGDFLLTGKKKVRSAMFECSCGNIEEKRLTLVVNGYRKKCSK